MAAVGMTQAGGIRSSISTDTNVYNNGLFKLSGIGIQNKFVMRIFYKSQSDY